MASGISLELQRFDQMMDYRRLGPREKRARDRSLRGKERIRQRKFDNKASKVEAE